jgi:catechol 2,3-dioxygenase-like lactoylglutathione lyase family enzyme
MNWEWAISSDDAFRRIVPSLVGQNKKWRSKVKVERIVANIAASDLTKADAFYNGIFGLELLMDHGWIRTYGSKFKMAVQISVASEGGCGTPVPDLSIEVDDLDAALEKIKEANICIEYGPATEPWGLRRFYVRDPFGKLVNVLQHA